MPGAVRRAQLASDVVQPEDGARVHAGAGNRRVPTVRREAKFEPAETNLNLGFDANPPADPRRRRRRRGYLLAWDPVSRMPKPGASITRERWNGGVLSHRADSVFQGAADGASSSISADKGTKLWEDADADTARWPGRSATRSTASSTSPLLPAGRARWRSSGGIWRSTPHRRASSRSSSAAPRTVPKPSRRAAAESVPSSDRID